jgi:hypothetical protein
MIVVSPMAERTRRPDVLGRAGADKDVIELLVHSAENPGGSEPPAIRSAWGRSMLQATGRVSEMPFLWPRSRSAQR